MKHVTTKIHMRGIDVGKYGCLALHAVRLRTMWITAPLLKPSGRVVKRFLGEYLKGKKCLW